MLGADEANTTPLRGRSCKGKRVKHKQGNKPENNLGRWGEQPSWGTCSVSTLPLVMVCYLEMAGGLRHLASPGGFFLVCCLSIHCLSTHMDMQNEGKGIAQPKGGQYLSRNCRLGSVSFILSHPCSPPRRFFFTQVFFNMDSCNTPPHLGPRAQHNRRSPHRADNSTQNHQLWGSTSSHALDPLEGR